MQNGTPLPVLQQLGGWNTIEMVMRYARLAPGYLAPYAEKLAELRAIPGTVASAKSAS